MCIYSSADLVCYVLDARMPHVCMIQSTNFFNVRILCSSGFYDFSAPKENSPKKEKRWNKIRASLSLAKPTLFTCWFGFLCLVGIYLLTHIYTQ